MKKNLNEEEQEDARKTALGAITKLTLEYSLNDPDKYHPPSYIAREMAPHNELKPSFGIPIAGDISELLKEYIDKGLVESIGIFRDYRGAGEFATGYRINTDKIDIIKKEISPEFNYKLKPLFSELFEDD